MSGPLVSIVMPHWQVKPFVTLCLRSIRKYTRDVPYEVIVVDNGSKDESLDYLRGLPWIRLIERGDADQLGARDGNRARHRHPRGPRHVPADHAHGRVFQARRVAAAAGGRDRVRRATRRGGNRKAGGAFRTAAAAEERVRHQAAETVAPPDVFP